MNAIDRAALHQAIMNLPCDDNWDAGYKYGHRDARHAAAELVLAAEPAERADQWQPIASAPKDGTKVLLYWPHWSGVAVIGYNADRRWISMVKLSDEQDPGPTHWRPLPLPPQEEQARG